MMHHTGEPQRGDSALVMVNSQCGESPHQAHIPQVDVSVFDFFGDENLKTLQFR
jgi:hypothetical protein